MVSEGQFIMQKEINWSLFNYGLAIPVSVWNLIHAWDSSLLIHGASKNIKIILGNEMFDAKIYNTNFDKNKFVREKDILQIRFSENSPLIARLRAIFPITYQYFKEKKKVNPNSRKQIPLPKGVHESIRLYFTSAPDVFLLECQTNEEYTQVANMLKSVPEELYEASDDDILFMQDKYASIIEKERVVKYRRIDRSIIEMLKKHYDYCDQISGEKIGAEYGNSVVEAHHIDYFTTSQNNDTTNIIIISPNYHRIIHKNNPIFNRKKYQFEFPNGELLKLKLYDHLQIKT